MYSLGQLSARQKPIVEKDTKLILGKSKDPWPPSAHLGFASEYHQGSFRIGRLEPTCHVDATFCIDGQRNKSQDT